MAATVKMSIAWVALIVSILSTTYSYDIYSELHVPGQSGTLLEDDDDMYLPTIRTRYYRKVTRTAFTGHYNGSLYSSREISSRDFKMLDMSRMLSYETVSTKTGKRTVTYVNLVENTIDKTTPRRNARTAFLRSVLRSVPSKRTRREVYGKDDRSFIPMPSIGQTEPFLYTVKISTGCTGILISPRHVLTAAHCIHDQKDYVEQMKNLKIGFLRPNGTLKWIRVTRTKLSRGWIDGGDTQSPHYDYALLKMETKHDRPYIKLSVSESDQHGSGERIYFTSFEDDKPDNTLWYRSCTVEEDDKHFLYHHCDAQPGSSGSGVYAWTYDKSHHKWAQELVGVFSGNRWRTYDEFYLIARNFNVAVRLTSAKYAQICRWMGRTGEEVCHLPKKRRKKNVSHRHYGIQFHSRERSAAAALLRTACRHGKKRR